ncbi:hypothetical protein A2630_04650 [Candidatus Woesebacteria bacterium RIFCSPHIGHO2_01_FULL_44_10]|uniref:Glycosyltransferase RgtA/B/C/D-like domain-containing protein n=1 Tax=Candidatus Woesebacteria bacterium RIFCSPLOWO2_01_FULL_44_14 TaxID=1802525 RepID=A0A1F8C3N0_9BACT|nr:MAG: hypothetical protein A2630_04650 [Candidatus Woesebacteria bacterium RIFCSPHIGHO2_01_FULL_44_10]OGM56047.1 MAG: hypothetical protein A3F62_03965 [Candidatus Woesebacteria bacterium RIFCSPHIGHO2_12_FULL_44_11]OGM70770.1 MAG: hypothetical protein A2975_02675 [Candidatus Woesebacteria bacterium RIFCSPLOWO2_01_FULL_44_14]
MRKYLFLILLLGVHLFLLLNLQFTAWPEMLSYPYLKNHGFLLYRDMIHPYPPLLTLVLSWLYKFLGYKLMVMKIFTWSLILANDVLVFLIVNKLTKKLAPSLWALIVYILTQPFLEGNMLWFDNVIVTPILLGTFFMLQKKYFWAGLSLALAALTKQTAGLFLVLGIAYLVFQRSKIKNLTSFLAGPVVLGLVLGFRLLTENQFTDFINWTLIYPATKWGQFPGYIDLALSQRELVVLVLLVLPAFAALRLRRGKPVILFWYFLVSLVMIYPRFSFFHAQTAIAFVAIIFGLVTSRARLTYLLLIIVAISLPAIRLNWQKPPRFYGANEQQLAQVIKNKTASDDKIYLLNLSSQYYVLADHLPAKPWSDNFGWYFAMPGVEEELILRWEKNPPSVIFWRDAEPGAWWELGTYEPPKLTNFIRANYTRKEEIQKGIWLWRKN